MGIASTFTQKIADEICERIATGEPLRAICRDDHMPARRTVYDWMDADPDFAAHFARAREVGFDEIAEGTLEIADDATRDTRHTERGEACDTEWVARSKLRVETRLKLLAKWSPKKYGEKTSMEVTGANGGPVQVSETERASKLAGILALARARRDSEASDDSET